MKNKLKLLGIIAVVAVIGFSMVGCDNGNNGGGYGVPSELIGSWTNAAFRDLEFRADGWMHYSLGLASGSALVGTSGSRISGGGIGFNFALSNNNNTLTITNESGVSGLNGVWTRRTE